MNLARLWMAVKAARQLGLTQAGLNAVYRFGLLTGHYRRMTKAKGPRQPCEPPASVLRPLFTLPSREQLLAALGADGRRALLAEADEIVSGQYRQFGGDPVEIQLAPPGPLRHWTESEFHHPLPTSDIKFIWEPARFGWAFTLGRAFHVSGDETYAAAFWRYFETFQAANPPDWGPNWESGQEVGLRLMAFVWAGQVFAPAQASLPERLSQLTQAVADHAQRIPPTLIYARSQNNNHLLTEAAALYTAALALPTHPEATGWKKDGQKWLNWCFENQIDELGEYVQHSTNYHRLMLQVASWIGALTEGEPEVLTEKSRTKIWAAVLWLALLINQEDGQVPNLGPNDGAYIFPLTTRPFKDFLPVMLTALCLFESDQEIPGGEMALWFQRRQKWRFASGKNPEGTVFASYRIANLPHGRAFLRVARLNSRPGHADQLHLDLWWRSLNLTLDPGTYSYNAPAPWDNALTSTSVHNTVTVNHADQMPRASRFLHLDWRAASVQTEIETLREPFHGEKLGEVIWHVHRGYFSRFGILHKRAIGFDEQENTFAVRDRLQTAKIDRRENLFTLQWLLPDWKWQFERQGSQVLFRIASPDGEIKLKVHAVEHFTSGKEIAFPQQRPCAMDVTIVRAGEIVFGTGAAAPARGWFSPTYAVKTPALSFAFEVSSKKDLEFVTEFTFRKNQLPVERLN
jgi:hypothetical protein